MYDAIEWVKKYTHADYPIRCLPDENVVEELQGFYNVSEPTEVYRGLIFSTKEKYDAFMSSIKDGYLKEHSISSWSTIYSTAETYAHTRMAFNITREIANAETEREKAFEKISGYRGVVLKAIATNENTLVDVMKTGVGVENEIILMPADIQVSVFNEILRFEDEFQELDVNEYILSLKYDDIVSRDSNDKFLFVINRLTDKINDKSKQHLFNLFIDRDKDLVYLVREEEYKTNKEVATIYGNSFFWQVIAPLLSEEQKDKAIQLFNEQFENLAYEFDEVEELQSRLKVSFLKNILNKNNYDNFIYYYGRQLRKFRDGMDSKIRKLFEEGKTERYQMMKIEETQKFLQMLENF